MSILPKWADQILSGNKKWEYRRILIKAQPESRIIYYASKGIHAIVGEATIDRVIYEPVESLIEQTANEVPEKPEELRRSFAGKELGCAIKIKNPLIYKRPITLHEIQNRIPRFRPPQSFCYIPDKSPLIQML
jgi:predicted transcriptional regulator